MNNTYRVKMKDEVNGQSFTFTMTYTTGGANGAEFLARKEFGHEVVIVDIQRLVEGGYTKHV